ncbi:uncharacterized protein LOC103101241 isoform X2 [Monodelphis domestica]|uniref:uncharacterized protein LOC103101241 isoform X2 n=1 Tax=Monodelphis domestica TaxID=13616 RepID=UPI0024E1F807|nr:uncharacterized protein LOC103101241 isoform X2 [Monodelphis domestica]
MTDPRLHGDEGGPAWKGSRTVARERDSPSRLEERRWEGWPGRVDSYSLPKVPLLGSCKENCLLSPGGPKGRGDFRSPRQPVLESLHFSRASTCSGFATGSCCKALPAGKAEPRQGSRGGDAREKPLAFRSSWQTRDHPEREMEPDSGRANTFPPLELDLRGSASSHPPAKAEQGLQVRKTEVSETEDSEQVRTLAGLLFEPAMDRNPNYADFSPQRNLTENLEGLEVPFVEAFAKDDIDATVKAILCRENYVIKEVDKYLQHQDFLNARRREMLHKRWVENVASPLQQKIMDKVGSPREIEKRKCQELDGYLKFKNSVGYVSLETYDSKIYDPFYMMNKDPCYLKVILPPFHDPLLKAQDDRDEENRVLLECERGKIYTMKKFRDAEKAELLAKLPQTATVIRQNMGPNEWLAISAGYVESDHCKKSSSPGGPTELDSSGTKGAASQARRPRTSLPKQPPEAKPHQEAAGDERRDSVQGAQQPVPKARQGANQNISDVAKDPP